MSEFARPVSLDTIGAGAREIEIAAKPDELAALAARFGWQEAQQLSAQARVAKIAGGVEARGEVQARIVQSCVVTGAPVPEAIAEPFSIRFVDRLTESGEEEVELAAGDLDTLPIEGGAIDLGEAVAQTVALAAEPFPKAPGADERLREAGVLTEEEARQQASPFAQLKGLLDGKK